MARKTKTSRSNDTPMPATAGIDKENRWRARDALSTLTRAEEIKRDKPLMREVKAEAKQQAKAINSVISTKKKKVTP